MLAFVVSFFFAACGRLSETEYRNWCEATLYTSRKVNEVQLNVQYLTPEYRWLQAQKPESLHEWMDRNRNKHHFLLRLNLNTASKSAMSPEMKYYFSYNFQDDIYLQNDGAIVPCSLAHLENPQANSNSKTFHLAFDSEPFTLHEVTLVINSATISAVPIKVNFDISNLPQLKL